jgi:hypothetical protein
MALEFRAELEVWVSSGVEGVRVVGVEVTEEAEEAEEL